MKRPLDKLLPWLEIVILALFIMSWLTGRLHEYGCWWQ